MESGKWKVDNGKWKMENSTSPLRAVAIFFVILSKRSVAKDPYKWRIHTSEGSIQVKDPYKCKEKSIELNNLKVENGKWKMESGKWKVENGKWIMESGKWKVENGKWKIQRPRWGL
jgi:hypothetical protein